jgi:hypothetical protein
MGLSINAIQIFPNFFFKERKKKLYLQTNFGGVAQLVRAQDS